MSTSKRIDQICIGVLIFVLILTTLFINAEKLGVQAVSAPVGYASRLFDTATVHTIDIVMDDWDTFIENCTDETYETCAVVIDGEAYKNVAIRAKGNTSLSSVESYGNNRYSFKIEFDHYDNSNSYYGLDKLCLNNIIQDNTYMKDYLAYQMMSAAGADAPLCSYAYITVNGEDWGLYLAVEAVEDSFLQRNYGSDYGKLYKPDSSNLGGGRGNGRHFEMPEDLDADNNADSANNDANSDSPNNNIDKETTDSSNLNGKPPENSRNGMRGNMNGNMRDNMGGGMHDNMNGGMRGSEDVLLKYSDDEPDSYSNIFDNAKTDISDSDKARLISSLKQLNEGKSLEEVVDIDEVLHYFVVHNFVLNFDSYTGSMIHNYYLYEKDGRLSMIPWDYNLSFSGFTSGDDASTLINYPIDTPVSGGSVEDRPMLAWIFNNEEYTNLYHQYFKEFISEYFDSGYFTEMADSVSEMISPYVEKDPTKFCSYEEFELAVTNLKKFCLLRAESVSAQLDGTIASTSDGQAADSSSFIDAGDLKVSSMGSMGMGKGGAHDRGPADFQNFQKDGLSPEGFGSDSFGPPVLDPDGSDRPDFPTDPVEN